MTVLDRILARVDVGDCWLWTGPLTPNGYAQIQAHERRLSVHRAIWQELVGPIPDGMEIDHLCKVRHCCNPDHLEPVTRHENIRRSAVGANNRGKTHCPAGHPYDDTNTLRRRGKRECRACDRARKRKAAA